MMEGETPLNKVLLLSFLRCISLGAFRQGKASLASKIVTQDIDRRIAIVGWGSEVLDDICTRVVRPLRSMLGFVACICVFLIPMNRTS